MSIPKSIIQHFSATTSSLKGKKKHSLHFQEKRLYISDFYMLGEVPPLAQKFDILKSADIFLYEEKETSATAYAEILLSKEAVHHWEMMRWSGQEEEIPAEGEIFGVPCPSGLLCLYSEEVQKEIEQSLIQYQNNKDPKEVWYNEFLIPLLEKTHGKDAACKNLQLSQTGQKEIFIFEAGYGEGFYGGYIGYSKNHQPIKIILECIEITESNHD